MTPFTNIPPWLLLSSGAAIGWLRNFWDRAYQATFGHVTRLFSVRLLVEEADHEEAYLWLCLWAEEHLRSRRISDLQLRRKRERGENNSGAPLVAALAAAVATHEIIPNYGIYRMRWRKRYMVVFSSQKGSGGGPSKDGEFSRFMRSQRSAQITIWGTRSRNLLTEILAEAQADYDRRNPATLNYFVNRYGGWRSNRLTHRDVKTIYLPNGIVDGLLADMQTFLAARDSYRVLGIPWRRGYLFEGPPGTGKSSLVQAVAAHLRLPLFFLNLSSVQGAQDLSSLLDDLLSPCILLIEDVDCIGVATKRDDRGKGGEDSLNTSDLLNYLDGIVAAEGRLLILTTNFPENLDPALVRAGRVDRRCCLTYAEDSEIFRFYSAARAEQAKVQSCVPQFETFRALLPSSATIADAQALLLGHVKSNQEVAR